MSHRNRMNAQVCARRDLETATSIETKSPAETSTSSRFTSHAIAITMFMFLFGFNQLSNAADISEPKNAYFQFNQQGELVRPSGYREWIYIGSPLTPNDMNNGKAAFPEFHNVYIDPQSWKYWKLNHKFPDETLVVKELVSVGSKQASSGKGYFQGDYLGLEASLKSKKQFPDAPGNWGFYRFTIENSPQLRASAVAQPNSNCSLCHQANAATDQVFTQYYPVLRAAKHQDINGEKTK